ncbi:Hypothetical protein AA314_07640 [Archangium gephyra]|uniref:Uncharacterized protein n=1 Tax=Archangium gephyra TaxID=48 RepID=A0AAC8QEK4_9BACT|nr:Hypothetical protein AA314_07640 [Archangium gephyra]
MGGWGYTTERAGGAVTSVNAMPVAPVRSRASFTSSDTTRTTFQPQVRNTLASPVFEGSMRSPATALYSPTLSGSPSSGVQYCTSSEASSSMHFTVRATLTRKYGSGSEPTFTGKSCTSPGASSDKTRATGWVTTGKPPASASEKSSAWPG